MLAILVSKFQFALVTDKETVAAEYGLLGQIRDDMYLHVKHVN